MAICRFPVPTRSRAATRRWSTTARSRSITSWNFVNIRPYPALPARTEISPSPPIDRFSRHRSYGARKVILATGYYDLPNYLEVPGEELPKVLHYYHDPHPYYDQKVLVIGGKNSAAIAALDLWRHGAHVTLVHRGEKMHHHVKYWILPDINNRIKNGEVTA